jgi:hypothetical protein
VDCLRPQRRRSRRFRPRPGKISQETEVSGATGGAGFNVAATPAPAIRRTVRVAVFFETSRCWK